MRVSLIVTVYNKAPFLKRCLDSVVGQYDKSAQVIVVDDGSTDGGGEICDKYANIANFEIYHTKNHGVSAARNYGLDKAKGEFVTFLDADDVLMPDAVACMERLAQKNFNIVQFGQFRCKKYEALSYLNYVPYRSPKGRYIIPQIPKYWVMVWNKLYKRSFIQKNGIKFKDGMQFGEDTVFNAECILANGGLYHAEMATIIHCLDDQDSLCRGTLTLERIEKLDDELTRLANQQVDATKKEWMRIAINEHRNSNLYKRYGFGKKAMGKYDIVYFVKEAPENPELVYSLRSVEQNWPYKSVWFCGGCPRGIKPDHQFKIEQVGIDKWSRVRNMIIEVCKNDNITEDFWLFNDDFFVLRPQREYQPQYNGELLPYVEKTELKQSGQSDDFTRRLREASNVLSADGLTTLNYEVHKPMLINRKKALEICEKYPNTSAFRSLYGNYWNIGGTNKHDMKIKVLEYPKMDDVERLWDFLSTSDISFGGVAGQFVRKKFKDKSRFEEENYA